MGTDGIGSLAPGSRNIARDEEWLVRRVDRTESGAQLLTVTGLSPLVRDREAKFVDAIEALEEPIHYFDKTIISIDTIKQDGEYRNHLENAWWDVIVINEAHNVARRDTNSMRSRVAELLSSRSDSLILLSPTPHDGKRESFASIMNMLLEKALYYDLLSNVATRPAVFVRSC